ncbi:MAG: UDP-diphosphatase [Acidimicrobiales bacterium]|nr:UDP-diphosphatase [Acidimicrobiales bacterium]
MCELTEGLPDFAVRTAKGSQRGADGRYIPKSDMLLNWLIIGRPSAGSSIDSRHDSNDRHTDWSALMDGSTFRWINRLADRTGWAQPLFKANAAYGIVAFAVLLLAGYITGRQRAELTVVAASVWAAIAAMVALGIGQIIGSAVGRARPYEAMTNVHLLVDKTTDFSFPSDHATVAGAVAVGLIFANRRLGIAASVLAALMAFTRVYVGAHYPADVLAGLLLGGLVATAGWFVIVPILTRIGRWLCTTPLRPLVTRAPRPQLTT